MVPVSFDQCAGWLHPGNTTRGVVLMSPFGFEELCARKAYVQLAEMLCARGVSVLRFDWAGTVDSLGTTLDPDLMQRWRANAQAAIDKLKQETGVAEIAVVGLRLGAIFAAEAAMQREDIRRLVLIAPPASGRAWLREAAAFGKLMSGGAATPGFDGFEAAGFRLGRNATDAITAWKWPEGRRGAPFVDIMNAHAGLSDTLADTFRMAGATVANGVFAGYEFMMCDPTASEIPAGTLQALAARIADGAHPLEEASKPCAFLPLSGPGFAEAPAQVGASPVMTGVLCTPLERAPRREAVILLNAGAIHHAGWARMHVDLARRMARHGIASLRLDLPGIGDSSRPGDSPVASLYTRDMSADVSEAIGWLKARGYRRITLAGACSGAYQAFHAALADPRVDQLVLLNQLCFVWGKSYALQFNAWQATKNRAMQAQLAAAETEKTLDAARALAGMLPIARKIAKSSLSALMSLQVRAANALSAENPVEAAFLKLSARGVRVLLAYSEGDGGLAELDRHMGKDGERATALPGVERKIIADADHMLTPAAAREDFAELLTEFLDRNNADANVTVNQRVTA